MKKIDKIRLLGAVLGFISFGVTLLNTKVEDAKLEKLIDDSVDKKIKSLK